METQKPLLKDEDGEEVDVHMYRSMIGSLMYLTSSRHDIMFAVCACARYQVNLKNSPFDLVAYTDSDYAGASLDRKSTTGGCQFLRCRLISWQCKKQTVVANSIIEAKNVSASSCCGQVLWIRNQLLDYGYNFMHTKIFIDNNRKAKKSVRLMMEKLFGMELELILLHVLVDGKKIIVTESSVRRDLQLEDVKGKSFSSRVTPLFPTMVVQNQAELGKGLAMPTDPRHTHTIIESSSQPQKTQKPRKPKRNDTQVPQPSNHNEHVADDAVHKKLGDSLVRAATTASSLESEQDSGNITKTRSKVTPNESSSLGTTS
ncbi:hypothetical protein Tco_0613165 [Tanacetum coccineum]